jgi:hypothetical protein
LSGALYSKFVGRASVMVFRADAARISAHANAPTADASASAKLTSPGELRDFGLKCFAAAETMEAAALPTEGAE